MVHNPLLLSKWVNMGEHVENKGAKGARRVNKLLEGSKHFRQHAFTVVD